MSYTHVEKKKGDLIKSEEWNAMGNETARLESDKVDRKGDDVINGPLTVTGNVDIGKADAKANLGVAGDISAENLTVSGSLTVEGDMIAKDIQHVEGDVRLGNEDTDTITVSGTMKSGHTSGALEIEDALSVKENLDVNGTLKTSKLIVNGKDILTVLSDLKARILKLEPFDGMTKERAAPSGYYIAQNFPEAKSGYYWIQMTGGPEAALEMYVDMEQEGGGYDFIAVCKGNDARYVNRIKHELSAYKNLDIVYPRSKEHWIAMVKYVNIIIKTKTDSYEKQFNNWFKTAYGIHNRTGGKNYTSIIMRSAKHYGAGTDEWRVPDDGRWWLRDTKYSEPNGDYYPNAFLSNNGINSGYSGGDITFNDGNARPKPGRCYLLSTNAKP